MKLKARVRQFFHGLFSLHRLEFAHENRKLTYLGCECGRMFYGHVPEWWSLTHRSPVPGAPK